MPTEEKEPKRILILCVDRDDDLGVKVEVKTPVKGRDENLNAAVALALRDPEEPDANAMFEAIRIYDRFMNESRTDEVYEIATISGSELGGVGADRKIVDELNDLLVSFPESEVILVTDGYSDEAVLPLVESRVAVSSVRRVVVKHSESIEETAALFSRYLRMIWENPRYARIFLGMPGLFLVLFGTLLVLGLRAEHFAIAFIIVLGSVFLVKGLGIDKHAGSLFVWIKEYSPPPFHVQIASFTAVAGFLSIGVGLYQGLSKAAVHVETYGLNIYDLSVFLESFPSLIGLFSQGAVALVTVGICVVLIGRAIRWYFERDVRVLRTAALVIVIAWSSRIATETSNILTSPNPSEPFPIGLIFSIVIGILLAIASFLVIFVVHRSARGFFKKTEERVEEFGEG